MEDLIEKKKKKSKFKVSILIIAIILLMLISFGVGIFITERSDLIKESVREETLYLGSIIDKYLKPDNEKIGQDVDFDIFWDAWDALQEYYVDKDGLSEKKMFYGAIRGMVSSLGDPYTVFMDPKISKDFTDDLAGTFEGIGAEIGIKKDVLTIIAPLPDMPAEKAGLKAGDKIFAINNDSTVGISIDEAVNKIRGPKDTEVVLSIFREGFDDVKDFIVKRGKIIVKSIRTELIDDIFVINIMNFNNDTEKLVNEAIQEVIAKNPKGIILDLRNNPGGYLDTAIEVASEWVEDGVIVSEKYSDEKKIEHLARGRARLKGYPTVVLINQGSASASEIVSGALQDYALATIIGKKTFGKGSVQTLTNLDDGSSLKITVAKWLTPKGRSINDEGIEPNIEVDLSFEDFEEDRDPQLNKALDILTGKIDVTIEEEKYTTSTIE